MNKKNGSPLYTPKREPLEYNDDRVYCTEREALCEGCPCPNHGFLCRFSDGTCLKTEMNRILRKELPSCRG